MFGFMKDKHDYRGYIASLDILLPIMTAACVMPTYFRPVFLLGGAVVPGVWDGLKKLRDIEQAAESCVHERLRLLEEGKEFKRKDIVASLFEIQQEKGDKVDFGILDVSWRFTLRSAITSVLYHLMKSPSAYNRLIEEIDEATSSGQLSHPNIRYNEAVKLRYLDACCKEGMRVHPSVGLTLPRHVPPGGCSISGQWFDAGTRVGVNAAVIHFDKSISSSDADEFNPERWFREDAANMDRYMFQAIHLAPSILIACADNDLQFGAGSRTCIGKNISLCEMYRVIPQLLRSYYLELAESRVLRETHNYWFNKPSNVQTRLRRR
ncbi:hypothetical protein H2199_001498 [Coniosporium tulheliwenetii]|uniref:Uncharacterized protein n=1 Tax=Coniosporium tulheliwenetii TaxID=3383036 RepID=A0ACC2ZJR6_9PEZI|nr:hypothetical protein H2199_001498 [Cladosporium sp. JES 115]